ncbi:putative transcription factor C3H family [Helianthus debilis subsp. tardiflorus]
MNPHEPPYVNNRRTTYIFYKTRMCQRFAEGDCPNGDSCTFAHGPKDLREPPPNWQELANDNRSPGIWKDDEKIIKKMRICRNFYNREICPYGEKCTFLHESPDKFKFQPTNDNGGSSGIKVETVVDHGQRQTIVGQDSVKTHGLAGIHHFTCVWIHDIFFGFFFFMDFTRKKTLQDQKICYFEFNSVFGKIYIET